MSLWPTTLLGLVLCLGKTIHMQPGSLAKPSIWAEPGPVVPRGMSVTMVCQGPAGADTFRLEKEGRYRHLDQKNVSPHGSQGTEARFRIPAVSNDTAGHYRCLYLKGSIWSERSEPLELKVADEDVSTSPSAPASWDYTVENCVRIGLAGTVLLLLVAILVEAGHSQRRCSLRPQD